MILEAQGDLLDSDCTVIVHVANCFHTMRSGIAAQIADRYHEAVEADARTGYGDPWKVGDISVARCEREGRWIVNLYSQFRFGRDRRHADIDAIRRGLTKVRGMFGPGEKIGMPRIGCGLGGLTWLQVRPVVDLVFLDREVYVYNLEKEVE